MCRPPFLFPDEYRGSEFPFSMREKVAEGRLRGQQRLEMSLFPLTLPLSLRERECFWRLVLLRKNNRLQQGMFNLLHGLIPEVHLLLYAPEATQA